MGTVWKPQPIDVYKSWIDAIKNEASDKLNDWEISFVESIESKLDNNWNLSEAQANKLESIYTKYTS